MKVNLNELDKYTPQTTKANYFSLKDDGDSASVRILYESTDDVDPHCCHKLKLSNGWEQWVECLRQHYDDPAELCPICAAQINKPTIKFWIPMFNLDTGEYCLWERGKKFWDEQLGRAMIERGQPFCGNTFTVERHGVKGDAETTYELVHSGSDDTTLDDFDEIPTPVGTILLEKSFEELENYVKTGNFDGIAVLPLQRRGTPSSNNAGVQRRGTDKPNMI